MAGTSPAMTMGMDHVKLIRIVIALTMISAEAHAQSLPGGFVYLRDIDPGIIQDIRYATSNNFVGRPLAGYGAGECVVKREVGLRLKAVQQELAAQSLSLKMFDCYRPARASLDMVKWSQNGYETAAERRYNPKIPKSELFRLGYIASRSQHSTGAALDLTLVDLKADNSARYDPVKSLCRLHGAGRGAIAGGQRRHGHGLRLHGREGAHCGTVDQSGPARLAQAAGGRDGEARLCELCEGVVAFFPAGGGRGGL